MREERNWEVESLKKKKKYVCELHLLLWYDEVFLQEWSENPQYLFELPNSIPNFVVSFLP
jgi:hypothetical protein